jgi:hypothetical protein
MRKLQTTIALLVIGTLSAVAGSTHLWAASPDTLEKVAPQVGDAPGPDNDTDAVPPAENKGVIRPPPTGDTGIQTQVPDPNAGTPEEVIPPSGTPGGNPNVEPR